MSRPLPHPHRHSHRHPRRRTSRRAALGALLAVAATGCGLPDRFSPSPTPSTDGATGGATGGAAGGARGRVTGGAEETKPTPTTSATRGADEPDSTLVATVVADLSDAHARVRANRREHPALADRLRGLERLHARHAAELGGLVTAPASARRAEVRRSRVLPRLTAREEDLQQRLVDHAVAAESGALALLLAAMAAGLAQELGTL